MSNLDFNEVFEAWGRMLARKPPTAEIWIMELAPKEGILQVDVCQVNGLKTINKSDIVFILHPVVWEELIKSEWFPDDIPAYNDEYRAKYWQSKQGKV